MVGKLASRRAGKSLLAIVTILILPLLLLGGLYASQAWQGISFLDREIVGLRIAEKVYGTLLHSKEAWTEAELAEVVTLEAKLGGQSIISFVSHLQETNQTGHARHAGSEHPNAQVMATKHEHTDAMSRYLADVGDVSGLILDADARSNHLASAYIGLLPKAVTAYEDLIVRLTGSKDVRGNYVLSATESQQLLGRVFAGIDGLVEAFEAANRNGAFTTAGEYSALENGLKQLQGIANNTEMKLGQIAFTSLGLSASDKAAMNRNIDEFRAVAASSSELGFARLDELISDRRNVQFSELLFFGTLGMTCALLALLLSVFMFRRTFVQLDKVTDLHEAAEFARAETDRINGEVANLNVNLSDKIETLRVAQDEIIKKGRMEQLGQLTATVAHELRNPLGAVRTSAFLIEKKVAGKGLGIENQLQRINNGIVRCDNIITQLLDYSRTKKVTPRLEDMDEWLAQLVGEEAGKYPSQVIIECSLGLNGTKIPFDEARLSRAITNLMTNALEAMVGSAQDPSKKPTANPKIWVCTSLLGNDAIIQVRDNGPGIPAENLDRIREPLFTTKNFGTGLGIPAIEQIAEQHGGRLEVESRLGEGACFQLFLPMTAQSTAEAA